MSRRTLFHSAGASLLGVISASPIAKLNRSQNVNIERAFAMGLVQFPCKPGTLSNTYHMMRAGESLLEAKDILSTNPLFLTNQDDSLSDLGKLQVENACNEMLLKGINPSVVKYSLASKCVDTANIVSSMLMVGRNRIVPEFTFMDQRGVGIWDMKPLSATEAAIWALDSDEGGVDGRGGKPPPNVDGTPNETLFDEVTRLTQLLSVLETQYSGDEILLIFPDGTSPALLSCLIAGISLNDVHALNFLPGELRVGVNMDSSRQILKDRVSSPAYIDTITKGREELQALRKEHSEYLLSEEGSKKLVIPGPKGTANPRSKNDKDNSGNKSRPDIISAGALLAIGGFATIGIDKNGNDDDRSAEVTSSEYEASRESPSASASIQINTSNLSDSLDGMQELNDFQDVPVLSMEDRVKAAEIAMEEYLSQDDGGDAWLSSILEMRDEN